MGQAHVLLQAQHLEVEVLAMWTYCDCYSASVGLPLHWSDEHLEVVEAPVEVWEVGDQGDDQEGLQEVCGEVFYQRGADDCLLRAGDNHDGCVKIGEFVDQRMVFHLSKDLVLALNGEILPG